MSDRTAVKVSVSSSADGCQVDGETDRHGVHMARDLGVYSVMG